MAEFSNEQVKSFRATETIPAFTVVAAAATNAAVEVARWNTIGAAILGLSKNYAETGGAITVVVGGSARALALTSISAGALVTPNTSSASTLGYVTATTMNIGLTAASLTLSVVPPVLGVALSNATASGTVQILLQINSRSLTFS